MNTMHIFGPLLAFSFGGMAFVFSIVVIAMGLHTKCWQERLMLLSFGLFVGIAGLSFLAIGSGGILCSL